MVGLHSVKLFLTLSYVQMVKTRVNIDILLNAFMLKNMFVTSPYMHAVYSNDVVHFTLPG